MKKIYTLAMAILLNAALVFGQDTINVSDFATIGDTIRLVDDLDITGLTAGSAGPNQTWNYSNLDVNDVDTLAVLDASTTPYFSSMPSNTNLAIYDGSYAYMDVNANSASIVGLGGDILGLGVPVEIAFDDDFQQIEFPTMYQHATKDTSSFSIKGAPADFGLTGLPIQVDSIRVNSVTYSTDTVDGWGQLITLTDTFNCIRRWRTEYRIDSIFIIAPLLGPGWQLVPAAFMGGFPPPYNQGNPTIIEDYKFEWLSSDAEYIIMTIFTDDSGNNPTRARFLTGEKLIAQIVSSKNVTCNAGTDGTATVAPVFGTAPFTYAWDAAAGSQTTAVATGLGAGTYTVTITDGLGDVAVGSFTITEPAAIAISTTVVDASCATCTDGEYSAAAGGGAGGYGYSWSSGETSSLVTGVGPGTYTVTVTDASGCVSTSSVTVGSWPLSVAELEHSGAKVYPNPSNGLINLEMSNTSTIDYELINLLGEMIERKRIVATQGVNQLNLNVANEGIYFLNLYNDKGLFDSLKLTIIK
ncbi:MAG: T9SS type A sorting domain-containing protein [Flavobacteriales bacterium]|nr:T9SS type A sorting domain-containing protein [Flavobacteriales bacterium]